MRKSSARKRKREKKARAVQAAHQLKVPREVIESRKHIMKEAEAALGRVNTYPLLRERKEMEEAKRRVIESYFKGDDVVKQFILFMIHEHLSKAANMKLVENFEFYRKIMGEKAEPSEVRKNVYRTMFNYCSSLEGSVELLFLLGEIGDTSAAKVISRHLAFYMSGEQQGLQMLRNAAIEALEECKSLYALDVLLTYAKYADKNERFLFALREWEDKVRNSHVSKEEKEEYISEINELMMIRKERDVHYG